MSKPFLFVTYCPFFAPSSGELLDRIFTQVGLPREEAELVYMTMRKVASYDDAEGITSEHQALLHRIIKQRKPQVVITLGEAPFLSLTGHKSHHKWRGSQMTLSIPGHTCWLIPTYHPTAIMRQYEWLTISAMDVSRALRIRALSPSDPHAFTCTTSPSEAQVYDALANMPEGPVAVDLETLSSHITCIGLSLSTSSAICIPLTERHSLEPYWEPEAEKRVLFALRQFFLSTRYQWIYQNGIYDLQYLVRYLGMRHRIHFDTLIAQHVRYNPLAKSLDFLASMHCENYYYWKDDIEDPQKYWVYNCLDCIYTLQVYHSLLKEITEKGLTPQLDFQHRQLDAALTMCLRGVNCDVKKKNSLIGPMLESSQKLSQWITEAVGYPLNVKSPPQMRKFFYEEMGLTVVKDRKSGKPTTSGKAFENFRAEQPILIPLLNKIELLRSVGVYVGTFIQMPLDRDGRIRCVFNPAGTSTYRWSSSRSAFGTGTNLQNIPGEDKTHDFPNIREIFIPDFGFSFAEGDLKQADAQVVAWEADDADLKAKFRAGADIHTENTKDLYHTSNPTLIEKYRPRAKAGVHATNYVTTPRTLAKTLGILVKEAEDFINRWFSIHPGIKDWHNRVRDQMQVHRWIENRFGFRRYFYDRIEMSLPEAVAWIPQSTVALVISHAVVTLHESGKFCQLLLQVHDSVGVQFPTHQTRPALRELASALAVEIPYEDPLTIGADFKVSEKSWGDCQKILPSQFGG